MNCLNFLRSVLIAGTFLITSTSYSNTEFEDLLSLSLEQLMEVTIYTASQESEKAARSPSSISVITAQQLNEWGITSLHDAISLLPGIIKGETFLGQTTQTFRGVTPGLFNNKSLFLINGHPSYESLFGSTLLDYVPIEIVERIEVVRSPASVLYGTNSISGVINIITKQGVDNHDTASVRGGSNSHKYGSVVHHSENLSMAASVQRDDGYKYTGTNDEFANLVDMDYRYDVENVFIDGYGDNWRINAAFFDREKAFYGVNPWVWQNGIFETSVGYIDANKKFNFDSAELNFWLRYDISDKDIHIGAFPYPASLTDCRALNIPALPVDPCVISNPTNRTDTSSTVINTVERYSLEAQFKDRLTEQINYIIGATAEIQDSDPLLIIFDSDNTLNRPAFADKQDTSSIALYSQIKYQPNNDTLYIAGLRGEKNSEAGSSDIMPKLGVTHQVAPDTYFKALYSKSFRTPVFIEKYVNLTNVLIGNPDLKRETLQTLEIGLDSQINDNNQIQLVAYNLKLKNEILRFPTPSPSPAAIYENGAGKKMLGLEAEWKSILSNNLELILNAAYVDGQDKSLNENDAPLIANETLNAILTYHINSKWSTTLTAQHIGERDVVSAVTSVRSTLDRYQLFNLSTSYQMKRHQLRLILNNITNETYSYPEPVRRITADVPGGGDFSAYLQYQYNF